MYVRMYIFVEILVGLNRYEWNEIVQLLTYDRTHTLKSHDWACLRYNNCMINPTMCKNTSGIHIFDNTFDCRTLDCLCYALPWMRV